MSGGRQSDAIGVPPGAAPRRQHELVSTPVAKVRRKGDPDVRARVRHRAMQQGEAAVDAPGQQRGVLVVGLHDQAEALEAAEVLGERQRHAGPSSTERGVGHDVPTELFDERDARVFDAPQLLGISLRIRTDSVGSASIDPAVDAVARSGGTQMRMAAPVLDPAQEQRRAVLKSRRPGVEHGVCRVRPVSRRQNGILGVPVEQDFVLVW